MTEKRFTLAYETNNQYCIWWAVKDGDITLWKEETIALLNSLNEENEQLKKDCTVLIYHNQEYRKENEQLKASLYAEKTNTAEIVNDYSKQFKRHSAQFSFMMDLAEDLGVDVTTLEALDD